MKEAIVITRPSNDGRQWTIIAEPAVIGFRWNVYIHTKDVCAGALAMIHPGGIANGWTESELTDDRALRWLTFAMCDSERVLAFVKDE